MLSPLFLALTLSSAPAPLAPIALHFSDGANDLRVQLRRDDIVTAWSSPGWFFVRSGGGQVNVAESSVTCSGSP